MVGQVNVNNFLRIGSGSLCVMMDLGVTPDRRVEYHRGLTFPLDVTCHWKSLCKGEKLGDRAPPKMINLYTVCPESIDHYNQY